MPSENVPARTVGRRVQADEIQHFVHTPVRDARLGRDHTQVVAGGAARVKRSRLEHGAYLAGRVVEVDEAPPADPRLTAGRRDQTEQHPQGRSFAGAIRTDEGDGPPGLPTEIDRVWLATQGVPNFGAVDVAGIGVLRLWTVRPPGAWQSMSLRPLIGR
jgi:hypothetical protein